MKFTMAQPEVSCHPELLLDGDGAHGRLGGPVLLGRRARAGRRRGAAAAVRLARPLRAPARPARRARAAARRALPRPRRREPARRPRGSAAGRGRLLRQEHDADHPRARLVGRARNARHRRRDRGDAAARSRLRPLPALHRRLPDGCARRAGRARREPLPLVLDAGSRAGAGGVPRGARRIGVRLRHLPGRLPVEPRGREAARAIGRSPEDAVPNVSLVDWLTRDGADLVAEFDRLYVPRNDPRWLRRNALYALGNTGDGDALPLRRRDGPRATIRSSPTRPPGQARRSQGAVVSDAGTVSPCSRTSCEARSRRSRRSPRRTPPPTTRRRRRLLELARRGGGEPRAAPRRRRRRDRSGSSGSTPAGWRSTPPRRRRSAVLAVVARDRGRARRGRRPRPAAPGARQPDRATRSATRPPEARSP